MMEEMINTSYFWMAIIYFLGIIFAGVGIIIGVSRKRKYTYYTGKVQGTVVENKVVYESSRDPDGVDTTFKSYHAVIKYCVDEKEYTLMSNIHGAKPLHKIGDRLTVYYNPERSEQFFIEEEQYIVKKVQYIFLAVGSGIFAIGLILGILFALKI